jgi:hypothetical protein
MTTYQLQGFQGSTERGYDAERTAETLKDARKEAKYMLSEEYRRASEASRKLATVQIWKDGALIDEVGA